MKAVPIMTFDQFRISINSNTPGVKDPEISYWDSMEEANKLFKATEENGVGVAMHGTNGDTEDEDCPWTLIAQHFPLKKS